MAANKPIRRRSPVPIPSDFPSHLHPVLARVYASRDIQSGEALDLSLTRLLPFSMLSGIEGAITLLAEALRLKWRILVVGDFDADGATSTALAVRALRMLAADHVDFLVPNRFKYGYGLTPEIVAAAEVRAPDLIITVDNGISSVTGVEAAKARGMRVLVTDHHLPAEHLPPADAIVNPNLPEDGFPSKCLAGVGVIFYVMLALRSRLRETGWFAEQGLAEPNLGSLLDLVALGTVADVVPLDSNNRRLVSQGIARIRAGRCCLGIQALIEIASRRSERLVAADLGFALGPRLNAAGRLDDMSLGIRCLLTDDLSEARGLAAELDNLNNERREIEREMQAQALQVLSALDVRPDDLPVGVSLYNPDWHEGVIGILASRMKDRLNRPVIVLTDSGEAEVKGSARSIPGLHIRDTLDAVASRHPGLLIKFGGHAMAAGLTLLRTDLEPFRRAFDDEVRRNLGEEELQGLVLTDGELGAEDFNMSLAESLREAGPWGQGFPEPLFDGEFEVLQYRIVGERHLKLRVRHPQEKRLVDAIAFNADLDAWSESAQNVHLVYRLDVNEYRNEKNLQLIVEQWKITKTTNTF